MANGEVVNTKKNANLSEKSGLLWLWKNRLSITVMSNDMAETLIKSQRGNYTEKKICNRERLQKWIEIDTKYYLRKKHIKKEYIWKIDAGICQKKTEKLKMCSIEYRKSSSEEEKKSIWKNPWNNTEKLHPARCWRKRHKKICWKGLRYWSIVSWWWWWWWWCWWWWWWTS